MTGAPDWIHWQREHTDALLALQEAQRTYHRALSGLGFDGDGSSTNDAQKEALRAVDAARIRLDEVRARQPQ